MLALLQPDQASVVYEGKTGKIVLVHEVVTVAGGKRPSPAEVDEEALKLAKTLGIGGALKANECRFNGNRARRNI